MATQNDIRSAITTRIVEGLQAGGLPPWRRPWITSNPAPWPTNIATKRRYSGINVLLLQLSAWQMGYPIGYWATFNQWNALGCHVKKKEKATQVVFYKPISTSKTNDNGEEEKRSFPLLKTFYAFNLAQVAGEYADKVNSSVANGSLPTEATFEPAELAIAATGADIRFGTTQALYRRPPADWIECPPKETFLSLPSFYETLFHECVHWTESRLGWQGSYAEGELIAEVGACFLANALNIPDSGDLTNHNAYLQSWLKEMSNDHRFIFRAASQASKATDFILAFSKLENEPSESEQQDLTTVGESKT